MRKAIIDKLLSLVFIFLLSPIILLSWALAGLDTKSNGIFKQIRIGQNGKRFYVLKLRTMKNVEGVTTTSTTSLDPRITRFGKLLRKSKLDELPQLLNVLKGEMSLVGPRPDVPGFADKLVGRDKIILSVKPGITGPAQIHFKKEEEILADQNDPDKYNLEVIWPKKVEINKEYVMNLSIKSDFVYLIKTFKS